MKYWILLVVTLMVAISSCVTKTEKVKGMAFKADLEFLRQHTDEQNPVLHRTSWDDVPSTLILGQRFLEVL